jgi:hypothetical protein
LSFANFILRSLEMHIDREFWVSALTIIWEGGLKETGKLAIDRGLKAIQPYTDGLKALFQNKSKPEAIAALETDPAVQILMTEVTKLIEANSELKAALVEAIASGKYTQSKVVNINQSGLLNSQNNNINL